MLTYGQLDAEKQISLNQESKNQFFFIKNTYLKMYSSKCQPIILGPSVLKLCC